MKHNMCSESYIVNCVNMLYDCSRGYADEFRI